MRIIEETQLDFDDVLIQPKRSDLNSRSEVDVFREFKKDGRISLNCIPICCANMASIAVPTMAETFVRKGFLCAMEKHIPYEELFQMFLDFKNMEDLDGVEKFQYRHRIALSIGIHESLETIEKIDKEFPLSLAIINIDVANGYMVKLQDRVKEIRSKFPNAWIIAGTVVTGDIVTDLLNSGADIVRCGIGGGAMCLSRRVAGVGRPSISMLQECSDAAHQIHGYIMHDGGCKNPGDICKALGCADFVMVGTLFAGCEECCGDIEVIDGVSYRRFAGMSSEYIQNKYFGGFKSSYRSSEGRQKLIKIEGSLSSVIDYILGGIRSCMTYIGCHKIKHMQKHMVFYKVNRQLNTMCESNRNF